MSTSDPFTDAEEALSAESTLNTGPAAAEPDPVARPEPSADPPEAAPEDHAGPPAVVPTLHPEDAVIHPAEAPLAANDALAQAVVLRVLAWHNRHRLARPIRAEQVKSVGVVALPFVASGKKGPQPAFDERFADALSLRTLRRFVARHAASKRPGPADWPQRDVALGARWASQVPEQRYLITAAIEQGDHRLRLLLAPSDAGPVIGPHQWRWPPRLMAAAAGATTLVLVGGVGGVVWWLQPAARGAAPVAAAASAAASSAAVAHAAPGAHGSDGDNGGHDKKPASTAPAAASAAAPAGAAAEHTASAASAASAPVDLIASHGEPVEATAPAVPAQLKAQLQAQARPATPVIAPHALADAAAAAAATPTRASDHPLDLFALTSRPAATKAMAEHDLAGLRDLVSLEPHSTATHLEVMALQGRWLVVWWPFVSRAQAEHARAQWQAVVPAVATQGWQVMSF